MTGTVADVVLGAALGLVVAWVALLVVLVVASPGRVGVAEAMRLLPDVLRLLGRLARDPTVPRGARLRLWLTLAYLAMPFDLVPDVVPVIGHADDAVVVVMALRSVVRRAGPAAVEQHWPGTPEGLAAVVRAAGLTGPTGSGGTDGTDGSDGSDGTRAPTPRRAGDRRAHGAGPTHRGPTATR